MTQTADSNRAMVHRAIRDKIPQRGLARGLEFLVELSAQPELFTALGASYGAALAAKGALQEGTPEIGIIPLLFGLTVDGTRALLRRQRMQRWKDDSDVAKAVGGDYLDLVIRTVQEEHGYSGACRRIEARGKTQGTGIFQGGYFTVITLQFADGGEAKVLYKHNDKPATKKGGIVTEQLQRKGFAFVPRVYRPTQAETELSTRLLDHVNRGQFYQYFDGDTVENKLQLGLSPKVSTDLAIRTELGAILETVFAEMREVYTQFRTENPGKLPEEMSGLRPTKQYLKLQQAVLNKKTAGEVVPYQATLLLQKGTGRNISGAEAFSLALFGAHLVSPVPSTLIHGDLHQGNILDTRVSPDEMLQDNVKIIDWDNAEWGLPCYDFFLATLLNDYDRSPTYQQRRETFLRFQDELLPGIPAWRVPLAEFETSLSLLHRYYDTVERGEIREEFSENMLRSCKYLFERSREAIEAYTASSGDTQLGQTYEAYAKQRFPLLEDIALDPDASVAYAHHVNHQYRITRPADQAPANQAAHLRNMESLTVTDDMSRNLIVGYNVGLFFLSAAQIGAAGYIGVTQDVPTITKMGMALMPLVTFAMYKRWFTRAAAAVFRAIPSQEDQER